jgi:hypothetical protein
MTPPAPSTALADITDDLSVAPLDGRLAASSRYDEEIDLLARRDGRITAGSVDSSDMNTAVSACGFRDDDNE